MMMTHRLTTQQREQLTSTHPDIIINIQELIDGIVTVSMHNTQSQRAKKMTFTVSYAGSSKLDSSVMEKVKRLEAYVLNQSSYFRDW